MSVPAIEVAAIQSVTMSWVVSEVCKCCCVGWAIYRQLLF